jgi:hypothetical protein
MKPRHTAGEVDALKAELKEQRALKQSVNDKQELKKLCRSPAEKG